MSMETATQVNVDHALPISKIEQIKADLRDYYGVKELSEEQSESINQHINILDAALMQFMSDNHTLEKKHADTQDVNLNLYHGLKRMYNDLLHELGRVKEEKTNTETTDRNNPLEYMADELPYQQTAQRKAYIDSLIMKDDYDEQLKREGTKFLDVMAQLSVLDSSIEENTKSYGMLVRKLGFTLQDLDERIRNGSKALETDDKIDKPIDENNEDDSKAESKEDAKKKISFSKYLKKDETTKRSRNDELNEESEHNKKLKVDDDNGYDNNENINNGLRPILKKRENNKSKSKSSGIKFQTESALVTIYGDGLPQDGLTVSPEELKKILKPFKPGQPREFPLVDNLPNVIKVPKLDLRFDENVNSSDISELKGGPVPCGTRTPLTCRINFNRYSADLEKPAREPVNLDDGDSLKPIIARAFGQNKLLLRKDRGGLPYRRVPDVVRNNYPIRPR